MSARQSELTVIVKAKGLAGYVLTATGKSPKRFRSEQGHLAACLRELRAFAREELGLEFNGKTQLAPGPGGRLPRMAFLPHGDRQGGPAPAPLQQAKAQAAASQA